MSDWEAKAKRLARAVRAMRPNEEFCSGCGEYVDGGHSHGDGCVVESGELEEALADVGGGGGRGWNRHPRGDGSGA